MDVTLHQAARDLGTTVERVSRAVVALGIVPTIAPNGSRQRGRPARVLSEIDFERLRQLLGSAPAHSDHTREEWFALAALNLSPLGFRSLRAVARAAEVSPTTIAASVGRLLDEGVIVRRSTREVVSGRVVEGTAYEPNRLSPSWLALISEIREVRLPEPRGLAARAKIVPRRFWHLLGNVSPAGLPIDDHVDYIAAQLLLSDDAPAVAWALTTLPSDAIVRTARLRQVSEHDRGWLLNAADVAQSASVRRQPVGLGRRSGEALDGTQSAESEPDTTSGSRELTSDAWTGLPSETAATWSSIASSLPASAYLVGDTALTLYLRHRVSRELDFFLERSEDLESLAGALRTSGHVVVTHRDTRTLACQINQTRVRIVDASSQTTLKPTSLVGGIRVAHLEDLAALKLDALRDRGEQRDYYDLMSIEVLTGIRAEEGVAHALAKLTPEAPSSYVATALRALGFVGDVVDDPSLPLARRETEGYWHSRHMEIARWVAAFGGR